MKWPAADMHRIKAAMFPIIFPSFTNPTSTYGENKRDERMDILMAFHHLDVRIREIVAFIKTGMRETIAAEDGLVDIRNLSGLAVISRRVEEYCTWLQESGKRHKN